MQAAKTGVAMVALCGGSYGLLAYSSIFTAERHVRSQQTKLGAEKMAKYDLESRIRETEGQADALCTANEQLQQEIGDTTAQIGELQQELRRLNILRKEAEEKQSEMCKELSAAREGLSALRQSYFKRQEALLEAESSTLAAQKILEKKRHEANPLNHPRVKELLGLQ